MPSREICQHNLTYGNEALTATENRRTTIGASCAMGVTVQAVEGSDMERSSWLIAAGALNAGAALLHLACIIGGPAWYRCLGAGERMARMVERGSLRPALITLGIATMLGVWSAYAFSGAGVLPRLPLLRPALIAICAVYALRAAALPLMLTRMPDRSPAFLIWSSAIVLGFAVIHGIGIWQNWSRLA
jgi:hypothetical protein